MVGVVDLAVDSGDHIQKERVMYEMKRRWKLKNEVSPADNSGEILIMFNTCM